MSLRRRASYAVALVALAGAGALNAVAPTAAADRPAFEVRVTPVFSPNGDGVKDEAVVRYTLTRGDHPEIIIYRNQGSRILKTVKLGKKAPGSYRWTWDGKADGRVVQGDVMVGVSGRMHKMRAAPTVVDAAFKPTLDVEDGTRPAAVYPRSDGVLRDTVTLQAWVDEPTTDGRVRFRIRDRKRRVVLDRMVALVGDGAAQAELAWDAWRRGKALPRGRYSVEVSGRDEHGNRGSSKDGRGEATKIWVSSDRLVEREESFVVSPATDYGTPYCGIDSDAGNGCGDPEHQPCGTREPSALFPGGLSYRAGQCPEVAKDNVALASAIHHLEFPQAVRVGALRVSFTGAPTEAGSTDVGVLRVGSTRVASSTGGSSGWVTDAGYQDGHWSTSQEGQTLPPSAVWSFETTGTDSFDVASFQVDVRWLERK